MERSPATYDVAPVRCLGEAEPCPSNTHAYDGRCGDVPVTEEHGVAASPERRGDVVRWRGRGCVGGNGGFAEMQDGRWAHVLAQRH